MDAKTQFQDSLSFLVHFQIGSPNSETEGLHLRRRLMAVAVTPSFLSLINCLTVGRVFALMPVDHGGGPEWLLCLLP